MCTHMCMGTKTISIMDDAYKILLRNKMKDESFSEVIRRHFSRKQSLMQFAGAWRDVSDEERKNKKEHKKY